MEEGGFEAAAGSVGDEVASVSSAEQASLKSSFDARKERQDRSSVAAPAPDYFITTRLVERVVVENVRVVKRIELDVSAPTTLRAPWLMLLGENGAGKSSLLQVVALALVGDRYRKRLRVDPSHYLRHGERRGLVEVYLTGMSEPVRLDITRSSFKSNFPDPKVLLLGYGATRLLPQAGMRPSKLTSEVARVENLFNPFSPLGDATGWLLELPPKAFTTAAAALKGILDLDEEARLRRNRRAHRIEVEAFGERVPLEHLSDGYQSVLGLAVDVMSVMFHRWQSMEVAEGIVAIDELGAHLHPRWRMRIVSSLRKVFPRVQFLASTHDPLCLRGLVDGEVAVLRRQPEGGVSAITDLPPIEGLRVDQILTSDVFGLNSTIDPTLDALFARYYELKGKWTRTKAEENELGQLHGQLDQYEVLGQTARERLLLEAADDFLAQERRLADDGSRRELRATTKRRMAQLWAETTPLKPPPR
jgi:energy-coupling factor transporter ATP-binding protein EcfA2